MTQRRTARASQLRETATRLPEEKDPQPTPLCARAGTPGRHEDPLDLGGES
jgi:hypothetical protein